MEVLFDTRTGKQITRDEVKAMYYENRDYIKSTGFSSERYGVCEVCEKHVSEVWLRRIGTRSAFGHRECISGDKAAVLKASKAHWDKCCMEKQQ